MNNQGKDQDKKQEDNQENREEEAAETQENLFPDGVKPFQNAENRDSEEDSGEGSQE